MNDMTIERGLLVHLNVLHAAVIALLEACPEEQRERVSLSFEVAMATLEAHWDPGLFPEVDREPGRIAADAIRRILYAGQT